jgi:PPK2 family polyphosphate:nucleotide phosphotransferase
MAKRSARLSDHQFGQATTGARAPRFDLHRHDPAARPFSSGERAQDKLTLQALASELNDLQNLFYADRRYKLLVILQGTDASGKDGTIRTVFGQMSALGVHAVGWKAPTGRELDHDYLWRIHQCVPAAGEMMLFNRSHYEDVLVPTVRGWISAQQTVARYAQINDFERMLTQNGTVICKFFLHVSKDEQRRRLQQRLDDPTKNWKFAADDLQAREQWDAYQQAYNAAIGATGTPWAPWTIVPADSKTHRNLMIALAVKRQLLQLKLRFPRCDPSLKNLKVH